MQLSRNQFVLDLFSGGAERFEITLAALQDMGFDQAFVTGIEHNKYACLSGRQGFKFKLFNYSWYPINTQKIVVYRENVANPVSDFTYKRWLSKHSTFAESFILGSSEKHSPS